MTTVGNEAVAAPQLTENQKKVPTKGFIASFDTHTIIA